MIKSVTVRNYLDEEIKITMTEAEPSHGFIIKEIRGLGPAKANINISDYASIDGGLYNSARMETRDIDITLMLAFAPDIETARQNTYKYFPIKKPVTLIFDTDNRYAKITGYVSKNEPDIFREDELVNITVTCDDPYFYRADGKNITEFGAIDPMFEFPFENNSLDENLLEMGNYAIEQARLVEYDGDGEVGVEIHIHAKDEIGDITIYNFITKESMVIYNDKIKFLTGKGISDTDEIIISTVVRNTYAMLLRNGAYTNILNAIDRSSEWFQLAKGTNVFGYSTSNDADDKLMFSMENDVIYEGI